MKYTFDTNMAKVVGTNAATILENLVYWQRKNQANNTNLHDGKCWVYNSIEAWKELQPYLSTSQLRTAFSKLTKEDLIYVGCYNKAAYDRTKWYSVNIDKYDSICENNKSICQGSQTDLLRLTNEFAKIDQPIPVSKPISKPISNKKELFEIFRKKYPGSKRGLDTEYKNFFNKNPSVDIQLLMDGLEREISHREKQSWNPGWKMLSAWINNKFWEVEFADPVRNIPKLPYYLNTDNQNIKEIEHSKDGKVVSVYARLYPGTSDFGWILYGVNENNKWQASTKFYKYGIKRFGECPENLIAGKVLQTVKLIEKNEKW